jgi:hypothetical protein
MIQKLLKNLVNELEVKNIPYMLSGSLAMNAYTVPRMTLDVDIIIELFENRIYDFISIFRTGFYINEEVVKKEVKRSGMFNVIDHDSGFKIDFIIRKNTEYRKLEFSRKQQSKFDNFYVWIVTPEDLVISKLEWIQHIQSEKQMNDIENLLSMKQIDKNYIIDWCKKLRLKTFNLI